MAGPAKRGVDDDAVRHLGENLDDLVEHDRHVGESGRIAVRSAFCRWGVVFGHCSDPPVAGDLGRSQSPDPAHAGMSPRSS